jgi:hypothetical protein
MPAVPASFEVCSWALGPDREHLELAYVVEHPTLGRHRLVERISLPVAVPADVAASDSFAAAATLLAVAAGVSYFKVSAPTSIAFGRGIELDEAGRAAMSALYDEGLREFTYANDLPLPRPVALPPAAERWSGRDAGQGSTSSAPGAAGGGRLLIPIGAGRDSSLLAAVLGANPPGDGERPLLLAIGDNPYAARVAAATGLDLVVAGREIDPGLLELNARGALNGHVPVTAINSLIAVVVALATGCTAVVMANERSASQATRVVAGVEINHQYSKSFAFEQLLRAALEPVGIDDYFSALRPWGELPIAAAFAGVPRPVQQAFMSCNRAFIRDPAKRSNGWCGECPKCRSVFLSLAPFMDPAQLAEIFGRDLLADAAQSPGFLDLVDPDAKPFECVGEIDEARIALALLAGDDRWRAHAVVRTLAAASPPATTMDAFDRSADHAVPPPVLARLVAAIEPAAERAARTLAGLPVR